MPNPKPQPKTVYDPMKTPLGQAYTTADRLYAGKMKDVRGRSQALGGLDQEGIDELNRPQRETYLKAKADYDRQTAADQSGFSQHLGTPAAGDMAAMSKANKKAGVPPPRASPQKLAGRAMNRPVTDPISGRKMQKGKPVPNAPGPDDLDIAADTVRRTGSQIGSGVRKAMSWTPDIKPPPRNSPLGQMGASLDDLSDTMQGKKKLSPQRLKGKSAYEGLKGKHPAGCTCSACKAKISEQRLMGPKKPKTPKPAAKAKSAGASRPNPFARRAPAGLAPPPAPPTGPFPQAQRGPVAAAVQPPLPRQGPGISYQGLKGVFQPGAGDNGMKRKREAAHYASLDDKKAAMESLMGKANAKIKAGKVSAKRKR